MRHNTKIAPVVVAAILTICTTGSATARDSVLALRSDVTALQEAVTINTGAIQIINLNQDRNIVIAAGYTGAAGFDGYYIQLLRSSEGCSVFVGDQQVPATTSGSPTILLNPFDIMDAGGVNRFINKQVHIPMQVGCFPDDDNGIVEKGHVTGTLFPIQAPLPHDHR